MKNRLYSKQCLDNGKTYEEFLESIEQDYWEIMNEVRKDCKKYQSDVVENTPKTTKKLF